MDNNQRETKFNGIGNVPFPKASPSLEQREEQAFYENNSGDGVRNMFQLCRRFCRAVKAPGKLGKRKFKLE